MNMKMKIMQHLMDKGIDVSKPISAEEYDRARLEIRKPTEILEAAARVTRSRISNSLGVWVVSKEIADFNLRICESDQCGNFGRLENSDPVCHACNCRGKDLIHKTRQSSERCPVGLWDNRKVKPSAEPKPE